MSILHGRMRSSPENLLRQRERTEELYGIYSTKENAETAIEEHKDLEGFRDCPPECFEIDEYEVDRSAWTEGFTTVRYGK